MYSAPLLTGIQELDEWLGLKFGHCIEWGIPPGQGGYSLLLRFLVRHHVAWIYSPEQKRPYPFSWGAWGIDLQKLFFLASQNPVKEVKPLFLDDLFKIIVIDSLRLSQGERAFLSARARIQKQVFFILQPYFLRSERGNPFASLRINCHPKDQGYRLSAVRGPMRKDLFISKSQLRQFLEFSS